MILQMLGCLYLSGWLIETVTVIIGLHKHGIKSPTYTLPTHCIAMMGAFPFYRPWVDFLAVLLVRTSVARRSSTETSSRSSRSSRRTSEKQR